MRATCDEPRHLYREGPALTGGGGHWRPCACLSAQMEALRRAAALAEEKAVRLRTRLRGDAATAAIRTAGPEEAVGPAKGGVAFMTPRKLPGGAVVGGL